MINIKFVTKVVLFVFLCNILTVSAFAIDNLDVDCHAGGSLITVESGSKIWNSVDLISANDLDDVQVKAEFQGYEYSDYIEIEQESNLFDMKADTVYKITFSFELPENMEDGAYDLRYYITTKSEESSSCIKEYYIESERHDLQLKDISFSPSQIVNDNDYLYITPLVHNYGQKDEESVKVTFSIPDLEIQSSKIVSDINAGSSQEVDTLLLQIPMCTTAGNYDAYLTIEYNERYDVVQQQFSITVEEQSVCTTASEKTNVSESSSFFTESEQTTISSSSSSESKSYQQIEVTLLAMLLILIALIIIIALVLMF